MRGEQADRIRQHARSKYVEPARQRGDATVEIPVRSVLQDLELPADRAPAVCGALRAKKFSEENHLQLQKIEGPPKKQAVTVKFTYRLNGAGQGPWKGDDPLFWKMRSILKGVFPPGEFEAFIRRSREHFYEPDKDDE